MSCPNCRKKMKKVERDEQTFHLCSSCGSSFFPENSINRISLTTAREMASDKKTDELSGEEKFCPVDKTLLLPVQSEAVPLDVTLMKCVDCRGIFTYPEDLVRFKRAQKAKITFFKVWSKPLPSLKSVLVVSFLALTSFALLSSLITLTDLKYSTSSAKDIISKTIILRTGSTVYVSFTTTQPVVSHIMINDKTDNKKFTITISSKPNKIHVLTSSEINPFHDNYYQLILTNENGKEIRTKEARLEFK